MSSPLPTPHAAPTRRRYTGPTPLAWVSIAFAGGLAILLLNAVALYRNTEVLRVHETWVRHTHEVLAQLELVFSSVKDLESSQRGFVLTGEDPYFAPFTRSRDEVFANVAKLRGLVMDNPTQREQLSKLSADIRALSERLDLIIGLRKKEGLGPASLAVRTGPGLVLMEHVREDMLAMQHLEQDLLQQRSEAARRSRLAVDRAMAVETAAIVLILGLAYYFVRRHILVQGRERQRLERDHWLQNGVAKLNEILRRSQAVPALCRDTLGFFADYLATPVATFYLVHGDHLLAAAGYAAEALHELPPLRFGEGLVGEAAASKRVLRATNLPSGYVRITSSLGSAAVRHVIAIPILWEKLVLGVIELGSLEPFTALDEELFAFVRDSLGVTLDAAQGRVRQQDLLEETQRQAEELTTQQESLLATNKDLAAHAMALRESQCKLEVQQEELHQSNDELADQARILEEQKADLAAKNSALELYQNSLEAKARELELAGRYKTEFLANMSHELRTPLNSLLILSTLLYEDDEGTLTPKQKEFAQTIHRAGSELLALINDILDLAKVEAGKLAIYLEDLELSDLIGDWTAAFEPLAARRRLAFRVEIAPNAPRIIRTDRLRLGQIIKNFLSNALKFTEQGSIRVVVTPGPTAAGDLCLAVADTGIGIADDQLGRIFEAFQQADGSTSRAFGGTGLGLTISRELALLLGGHIQVESKLGRGSVFSLQLPGVAVAAPSAGRQRQGAAATVPLFAAARSPAQSERLILIVEDDADFGKVLLAQAQASGFRGVLTGSGEQALEWLRTQRFVGVLLDLRLPDISGLNVLERMQTNTATSHIPIHIVSGSGHSQNALNMGAIGYLSKPATREQLSQAFALIESAAAKQVKRVLIVDDDPTQQLALCALLKSKAIASDAVGHARDAQARLAATQYDCMILDLQLPEVSGLALLEQLARPGTHGPNPLPPVVVYTGQDLSRDEVATLRCYAERIIIKGAKSPERLLDEVSLFLHRVDKRLPDAVSRAQELTDREALFSGRRILLVDDDMRNVFALANALESKGMSVRIGKNGEEALAVLSEDPGVELVLMDMMMPRMDGYEAMRRIRAETQWQHLPVLALTAKSMPGDQEACLTAGASDYMAKPVVIDKLLALLQVWLPPQQQPEG